MTIRRILCAAGAGVLGAVIAGCGASEPSAPDDSAGSGAAWRLNAGGSAHASAFQALQYYPNTITVNEGDTVTWTFAALEPHTVTFLGTGQATPPPPTAKGALAPAGSATYDGSTFTSSGRIANGFSYSLRFTKRGTYTYYCVFHQPEMQGTIIVHAKGTAYPFTEDGYSTQATTQVANDLATAAAAVTLFPYAAGGTHVAAGIAPGLSSGPPARVTVNRFLVDSNVDDSTTTIPVGASVTRTNQANNSPHTVTFPVAGSPLPELPGDPFTPPMGGSTYDGSAVTNSGVLNAGQSYTLTFTKAGTYVYYCLFHDQEGMQGTVIVQ